MTVWKIEEKSRSKTSVAHFRLPKGRPVVGDKNKSTTLGNVTTSLTKLLKAVPSGVTSLRHHGAQVQAGTRRANRALHNLAYSRVLRRSANGGLAQEKTVCQLKEKALTPCAFGEKKRE